MANLPISGLTASAANLAGTDLLPVVQTVGVGPVKMTGLQIAGGLLGSTALTGSTVTTSQPLLNLAQTWNAGAVTFTGLKFNVTDTASAAASLLMDLQVGGSSKFSVDKSGVATAVTLKVASGPVYLESFGSETYFRSAASYLFRFTSTSQIVLSTTGAYTWSSVTGANNAPDLFLTRAAAATLQLGAADAASPVAQTLGVQNVAAGTTNTAGANFTINGSRGTGTGAGGSIIFQVAPAGTTGTAQNAFATALTIDSAKKITTYGNIDSSTANATALQYSAGSAAPCVGFTTAAVGLGLFGTLSAGYLYGATYGGPTGFAVRSDAAIGFLSGTTFPGTGMDTILTRPAAATFQLGAADAAAPVAQALRVQSVVAGTSNTAGQNFTIRGSVGTGTGVGGSIIFQTAPAGSTGTAQNSTIDALTVTAVNTGTLLSVVNSSTNTVFTVSDAGAALSLSTGGIGYGAGAGGTVTQITSRTTGVTINKTCGAITLVSAAGSTSYQTFTVTNSTVAATDVVIVNQKSGADLYEVYVTAVAAGSFNITFATTGGTTTEQPVFNFAVIKAVAV